MGFARPKPEAYLLPSERRVLRCRRHWVVLFRDIVLTTCVVVALFISSKLLMDLGDRSGVVQSVLWYAAVGMVVRLAVQMADWWDDILMITDERIMNVTGLIASRMKDTPLSKITDRDIQHTLIGNLLGYGTIIIESAGHKSMQRLRYVPQPMTVYEAIVKLTSNKGLPAPAANIEKTGTQPSVEDESRQWPVDGEE